MSCRDKSGCDNCSLSDLSPPALLAFSIPGGQVTYYGLESRQEMETRVLGGWAILSAETRSPDRLYALEGAGGMLIILTLPNLDLLTSVRVGGIPLDFEVEPTAQHVYVITRNAFFWSYNVSAGTFDTLGLGRSPRRMAMTPNGAEAWVACPGDSTVHTIDLRRQQKLDTLHVGEAPTDVQFSPDGRRVYVALMGDTSVLGVFDVNSRRALEYRVSGPGPCEIAVSDDGRFVAASDSAQGVVRVWDNADSLSWDIATGPQAGRVRFEAGRHILWVLGMGRNQLYRIALDDGGLRVTDTLAVIATAREFALWETVP